MNTMKIATKLTDICREEKNDEALNTLYSDHVVSVEAGVPPGMERAARGLTAVKAKGEWWQTNHEIHSGSVTGPWPHDDRFVVGFQYDVTHKPSGQRMKMHEVGLYQVRDGKIIREEFFYNMG
jgi:ketosteroid isomerase-like protein